MTTRNRFLVTVVRISVAVALLGLSLATFGPQAQAENRQLIEWALPAATGPGEISIFGRRIYFTEFLDSRLGALEPATNKFIEWSFPGQSPLDPFGLAVVDGDLVFSAGNVNQIMRLNPLTGAVKVWTLPTADSMPDEVAISGSTLYFTEFRGNKIGALDLKTNKVTEWASPIKFSNRSRLSGIAVTADATRVYFTQGSQIGALEPGTNSLSLWQVPGAKHLSRVKVAENEHVVAGDALAGTIVRLDPRTNTVTVWKAPTPLAMISDVVLRELAEGSSELREPLEIGFTEDGVNKLGKLLTNREPGTDSVVIPVVSVATPVSNNLLSSAISAVRTTSTVSPLTMTIPGVASGGFEEWAIPAPIPHPSLIRLAFFGDDGFVFTESLAARIGLLR